MPCLLPHLTALNCLCETCVSPGLVPLKLNLPQALHVRFWMMDLCEYWMLIISCMIIYLIIIGRELVVNYYFLTERLAYLETVYYFTFQMILCIWFSSRNFTRHTLEHINTWQLLDYDHLNNVVFSLYVAFGAEQLQRDRQVKDRQMDGRGTCAKTDSGRD